jgi:nicotinamide-nucleotide amidase
MIAEIITIGDEILIGQIVDTNSAWMGVQLNMAGIKVKQITSVSDEKEHILSAIKDAESRADLILMTGGLGPTKDDITKSTLAEYFNSKLVMNEEVLAMVRTFFAQRGRELTELNSKQAEVLELSTAIKNYNGTAPGMWIERNGKVYVSMPGVPFEMQSMINEYVIPEIRKKFKLPEIYHKTILTNGIGESFLAEKIEAWENSLSERGIRLAYLPSPSIVKLRLSTSGTDASVVRSNVQTAIEELQPLIEEYIFGYEEFGKEPEQIEHIIAELFIKKGLKFALAESCTGGYISHLITSVAGCSAFYQGCVVPYHNQFKQELLQVDPEIFTSAGAVSEACVVQMAQHALKKFSSDVALAVSGIAGPGGATEEKPVGTVWIAIASKDRVESKLFRFGTDRNRNIRMTAVSGLNMLRKFVLGL